MSEKDQLLRVVTQLDGHFAADDQSPADVERWRELKRHIARMLGALALIDITLRDERERGIPLSELSEETARKLEKHAKFGLGESDASD
jgi:hypothetical protein